MSDDSLHEAKFDREEPEFSSDISSKPVRENFQSLAIANQLRARALDPPEARIYITKGKFKFSGVAVYEWPGGVFPASGSYSFPTNSGTSRVDFIGFELNNGTVELNKVEGNPGTNPSPPPIPAEMVPVCFVHVTAGIQTITSDMISDARTISEAGVLHEDSVGKKNMEDDSVGLDELDPSDIPWLNQDGTLDV